MSFSDFVFAYLDVLLDRQGHPKVLPDLLDPTSLRVPLVRGHGEVEAGDVVLVPRLTLDLTLRVAAGSLTPAPTSTGAAATTLLTSGTASSPAAGPGGSVVEAVVVVVVMATIPNSRSSKF